MRSAEAKKVRAVRLMSGKKNMDQQIKNRNLKTQIGQYEGMQGIGNPLKRNARLKTHHQSDIWKLIPSKSAKDRQELFEQNLQLRKKIHQLQNEINLGKGKIELEKKKNVRFTKKLQRQFEKEMYWSGNNRNLIEGVKLQYQKLKQQYQYKCDEIVAIKKNVEYANQQEYKIYAEILQQHNKQLMRKIQSLKPNNPLDPQQYRTNNAQQIIAQSYKQHQKIVNKNKDLQGRVDILSNSLQQKNKKIQFLEKLLIQRDNNQHNSHKKARQFEKEVKCLQIKIRELQEELSTSKYNHQQSVDALNKTLNKKYEAQQTIFQQELLEKQKKIGKLQKQVSYLSTLLSYWKPLDQLKKQDMIQNDNQKQSELSSSLDIAPKNQQQLKPHSIQIPLISRERTQTIIQSPQLKPTNTDQSQRNSMRSTRKQRTSAQKNTENSVKMRKIQFRQVQHFSPILKYRLIAHQVQIEEVKNYMTSNSTDPWIKQYITMSEVKSILKDKPFQLPESQAYLLSRYIIEDSTQEYVYCDETNELNRSMSKSILKALIGEYSLPNYNQANKEWNQILQKYGTNMKAALKSVAPQGIISDTNLGIEPSENCQLMLFGKMMLQSETNQKMKYGVILK